MRLLWQPEANSMSRQIGLREDISLALNFYEKWVPYEQNERGEPQSVDHACGP
jgi:hypothetical protein